LMIMGCACATCRGENNNTPDMVKYVNNDRFTHPGYCDYVSESNVNCGNNGEFVRDGNGVGKCKCRALCTDGCYRKQCKRVLYSGDLTKCCTEGGSDYYKDGNVVRTCDPAYRVKNWGDRKCDDAMDVYCRQGNNLFGNACRNWVTTFNKLPGSGTVDNVLLDVCNRAENKNKLECNCITAAKEVRELLPSAQNLPVQCMMNKCANNPHAYRTTSQMGPCNITNCQMDIRDAQIVARDPKTFTVKFTQICGNAAGVAPTPPGTDIGGFIKEHWVIIMIVVVAIVLLILMYLLFFSGSSTKAKEGGSQNGGMVAFNSELAS